MIKIRHLFILLWTISFFTQLSATCIQSADIQVGWRRDDLDWNVRNLDSSYISATGKSRIRFKDMESYTVSGKLRWVGSEYYIRLSAEYGLSFKGNAKERFKLYSSLFDSYDVTVFTNNGMRRDNEVYDFNGAVGYPFAFYCNRLAVIPMLGFSYHRQRILVKQPGYESSSYYTSCPSSYSDYSSFWSDNSQFFPKSYSDSSNPFDRSFSANPFRSSSSSTIASALGLRNYRRTQNYRFTWYGFYLGLDVAYALDSCWTLFGEFEGHFANRCHRKRKSWTGVYFIDRFHNKGWAWGLNAIVGTTYSLSNDWYTIITVDYKWRQSHTHHERDRLYWNSVGIKWGLGYMY